jgi:DNA-binding transcriptional LysR family regulator
MQQLRVAFVPGVTPDKWARAWRERNPQIRLELQPIAEEDSRAVLDEGTADMALARLPVDLDSPAPLHCVRLYDEQPVVVAARDHWVAAGEADQAIPVDDLADDLLDLGPEVGAEDAVGLVANGAGVVVLPMSVARLHNRKDVVHRPVHGPDPTTVALLWLRDADSDVHQDFVGVVRGRRPSSSR